MGQPKLRSALTKSLEILGGVAVGAVLRHIMQHDACSNTGTIGKQRSRIFAEGDRILAWRWCFFRVSKLVEKAYLITTLYRSSERSPKLDRSSSNSH